MKNFNDQKLNSGLAALVVVVVVGMVALTIALSTALLGVRELELATTTDHGREAKAFADGCLDSALLALRQNSAQGSYEFTNSTGRCIITITDLGGNNRRVVARGVVGENEQSLTALVTLSPLTRSLLVTSYLYAF